MLLLHGGKGQVFLFGGKNVNSSVKSKQRMRDLHPGKRLGIAVCHC